VSAEPLATPDPLPLAEVGFVELRSNNLGVRIAETAAEVDAVQALRYRVFYDEMGARADAATAASRRDVDEYDAVADHLVVVDHDLGDGPEGIVGCYRLIRRTAAAKVGRFYSSAEYDVAKLIERPGEIMELGRSCVATDYRTRGTMQLLWRGIAAYVLLHRVDLLFGCASLPGTNLTALAPQLTYLWRNHLAPEDIRPRALTERYVPMDRLPPDAVNSMRALNDLPPLIKGYLRLGGFIGDGAVLDEQFNTTDVCIVVKTDLINAKYSKHYERRVGWIADIEVEE
jgi:putative hemolysin